MIAATEVQPLDPIEDEAAQIAEATGRVHRWFREDLMRRMEAVKTPKIDKFKPRKFNPPTQGEAKPVVLRQPIAKPALRQPQPKVWKRTTPSISTRRVIDPADIRRLHAEGKTVAEMKKALGCVHSAVYQHMHRLGLQPTKSTRVVPGDVFGLLTVLRFSRCDPKMGRMFVCACSCGQEKTVAVKNLRARSQTSCGCAVRIWRKRTDEAVSRAVCNDAKSGISMSEVARRNGVSRTQVGRLIARAGATPPCASPE